MAIRGVFTSHSGVQGERQGDFASRILATGHGGDYPMTALSAGTPMTNATDTVINWREQQLSVANSDVAANVNSSATSIVVVDSVLWTRNSLLMNRSTGEVIFVEAVNGNTLTVKRGFSNSTPANMVAGQSLQLIGNAFPEGSLGAAIVHDSGEARVNYTQIFRGAYGATGTAQAVQMRSGNPLTNSRDLARAQIGNAMESALMFGVPSQTTIEEGGERKRLGTMAGLEYAIKTWGGKVTVAASNAVAGRLNMKDLTTFIADIYRYNIEGQPNERVAMTGNGFLLLIDEMVKDMKGYQVIQGADTFGLKIKTLVTPVGDIVLKTHPTFNANPALSTMLMVYHPGGLTRRELQPMKNMSQNGLGTIDGRDATIGHFLTEMTCQWQGVRTYGMLTGAATAGGLAALPTS